MLKSVQSKIKKTRENLSPKLKDAYVNLCYARDRWKLPKRYYLIFNFIFLIVKRFLKIDFEIKVIDQDKIDVVIPTISKDSVLLQLVLDSLKNIPHKINKIYIVSYNDEKIKKICADNGCVFINEYDVLGYNKEKINYQVNGVNRCGWMYQQLLKLSGDRFVEMENYLAIDSDTVLVSKNVFLSKGKFVFWQNREWNQPYFDSFAKIFGYKTKNGLSFTSHMMIFNVEKIREMKKELEKKWSKSWDMAYLLSIDNKEMCCISDYDTYANWMLINYPDRVLQKPFYNTALSRKKLDTLNNLEKKYGKNYKSISFHSYLK